MSESDDQLDTGVPHCYGCWKPVTVWASIDPEGTPRFDCDEHGRVPESWIRYVDVEAPNVA